MLANYNSATSYTWKECTPLYYAIFHNKLNLVKWLISKGADVNKIAVVKQDETTLESAAAGKSSLDIIQYLLEKGAIITKKAKVSLTKRLFLAVSQGDINSIEKLISFGVDITESYNNETAILKAANYGCIRIVQYLQKQGAEITPLVQQKLSKHLIRAASDGDLEKVKILLELGANINHVDRDCHNSISIAARKSHFEVVAFLKEKGAAIDSLTQQELNKHLIYAAGDGNNLEKVKILLDLGADVNYEHQKNSYRPYESYYNVTPLLISIEKNNFEIMQYLKDSGAKFTAGVYEELADKINSQVRRKNIEEINKLLVFGADINKANYLGNTPLHEALLNPKECSFELIEFLIAKGANINAKNKAGNTPLYQPIKSGSIELIEFLIMLSEKKTESIIQYLGDRLIDSVSKGNNIEDIEKLVNWGAQVNYVRERVENYGRIRILETPLYVAVHYENQTMVQWLLDHEAEVDQAYKEGKTPLMEAAELGNIELIKLLLENKAMINKADENGRTALYFAIANKHFRDIKLDVIDFLIQNGAELTEQIITEMSEQLIHASEERGSLELIKNGQALGANIHYVNNKGDSPIYAAASSMNLEVFRWFVDQGVEITEQTRKALGQNLFQFVRSQNLEKIIELVNYGADVNVNNNREGTLLFTAAKSRNIEIIQFLLDHGARVTNEVSAELQNLLFPTIESGNLENLTTLFTCGVNIHEKDSKGCTAIIKTVVLDKLEFCQKLVQYGADPNEAIIGEHPLKKIMIGIVS